ncbi:MAG: FxLYD domain-containing protein [Hyphomicrobiaceae bacterium]
MAHEASGVPDDREDEAGQEIDEESTPPPGDDWSDEADRAGSAAAASVAGPDDGAKDGDDAGAGLGEAAAAAASATLREFGDLRPDRPSEPLPGMVAARGRTDAAPAGRERAPIRSGEAPRGESPRIGREPVAAEPERASLERASIERAAPIETSFADRFHDERPGRSRATAEPASEPRIGADPRAVRSLNGVNGVHGHEPSGAGGVAGAPGDLHARLDVRPGDAGPRGEPGGSFDERPGRPGPRTADLRGRPPRVDHGRGPMRAPDDDADSWATGQSYGMPGERGSLGHPERERGHPERGRRGAEMPASTAGMEARRRDAEFDVGGMSDPLPGETGIDDFDREELEGPFPDARRGGGRRAAGVLIGWLALVLALAGLIAFLVLGRVEVARALPGSASIYAALGMPVNVRGLVFHDVAYQWSADGKGRPALDISGEIENITDEPVKVPTVVFAFLDEEGLELFSWATPVRRSALPPGKRSRFQARIPAPPEAVHNLQVRFAIKR